MLEKHVERHAPVWETNNIWLAFLFVCICWVAVMVLIIYRYDLNQQHVEDLITQRATVEAQIISLGAAGRDAQELNLLQERRESIKSRLAYAQKPPFFLYGMFIGLEGIFIIAFWLLLYHMRAQIPSLIMRVYLAMVPLGFLYFFLLVTLGRYHRFGQLVGDSATKVLTVLVIVFFSAGLVLVAGMGLGNRLKGEDHPSAKSL